MPQVTTLIAALLATLSCGAASAGATDGDLFGYRLGAKYQLTEKTQGYFMLLGQAVLVAERPEMPADFKKVELIASPKTLTIANIYASAEFDDEAQAKEFELRYADLLDTLYGKKCQKKKAYLDEALKLVCAQKFELTVNHFKPDKADEKHKVHVGLKFDNESPEGKKVLMQFKSELEQLEREGKQQRFEKARDEHKLRGLQ